MKPASFLASAAVGLALLGLGSSAAHATSFSSFVAFTEYNSYDGKYSGKLYVTNNSGRLVCLDYRFADAGGNQWKAYPGGVRVPATGRPVTWSGAKQDFTILYSRVYLPVNGSCSLPREQRPDDTPSPRGGVFTRTVYEAGARSWNARPVGSYKVDTTRWSGQQYPEIHLVIQ